MFIADVVNVRADTRNLNPETGKLELAETNPLVYVHGGYYEPVSYTHLDVYKRQVPVFALPVVPVQESGVGHFGSAWAF